eukprot:m.25588 g.25588  ORF g.25588 m.25588 type:complete len:552 (+) comp9194_c0_seq1:3-1658(+)
MQQMQQMYPNNSVVPPYVSPQMQMNMQQQQSHMVGLMMSGNYGAPQQPTFRAPQLVGGTEESRLQAAEAHLKMLQAESEVFEAQLRAAEATLALANATTHNTNADTNSIHSNSVHVKDMHDVERLKYREKAQMFRDGGAHNEEKKKNKKRNEEENDVGVSVKREEPTRRRSRQRGVDDGNTTSVTTATSTSTTTTNTSKAKRSSTKKSSQKKQKEETHELTSYERRHLQPHDAGRTSLPSFLPNKLSNALSGRGEVDIDDDVNEKSENLYKHPKESQTSSSNGKKKSAVEEIADQAKFIEAQAEALFGGNITTTTTTSNSSSSSNAGRQPKRSSDHNVGNRMHERDSDREAFDPAKLRSNLKATKSTGQSGERNRKGKKNSVQFKTGKEILGRNPNLDDIEFERLRKIEEREHERRRKFDRDHSKAVEEAQRKPPRERQVLMVGLDRKEMEEMERRKQWERNKEEREAKALMTRPDASADLEAYLEEEERKKAERERQRLTEEEEASALVDRGRVRKFAELFSNPENVQKYNKPQTHVMTWKVKEVHKYNR